MEEKQRHAKIYKATPKKVTPKIATPAAERSDDDTDDEDFCIICLDVLTLKLTTLNSLKCKSCERPVHRKCVAARTANFTC